MAFSNYIIYVDESGDHGLARIDPQYPVFVLSFCIFRKADMGGVSARIQALKYRFFGHDTVILHSHEIRKAKGPFQFLTNAAVRDDFNQQLASIVAEAPFTIIAAVIDKKRLCAQYKYPENPYELALRFCMERAQRCLNDRGEIGLETHLVVEARGKKEDSELELEFRRICDGGNYQGRKLPFDIKFASKACVNAGLELADLVGHPIGTKYINGAQPNRAYEIIEPKLRRSPAGKVDGYGRKVFP